MIARVAGAAGKGEARIPVEDRLFSLVLALLATETGLLKSEILSSVRGYAERYDESGQNANLERQFERDKDDIRELGIPLETVESPDRPGDNQALRYRIPKGSTTCPTRFGSLPTNSRCSASRPRCGVRRPSRPTRSAHSRSCARSASSRASR